MPLQNDIVNLLNKAALIAAEREETIMKCPRCGAEMVVDSHRKYDALMCYECGYMEGRNLGDNIQSKKITNYERLRSMNFNEIVAFLSKGLGVKEEKLRAWLDDTEN